MLGTTEKAQQRINEIIDFSSRTPFELEELVEADRQLQVYTGGVLNAEGGLKLIGDAAAANVRDIRELSQWVGRLFAEIDGNQKSLGESTRRLLEMGVITGKTRKEIENAKTAQEKWTVVLRQFTKFEGAMEKQSKTLNGLLSTLKDNF